MIVDVLQNDHNAQEWGIAYKSNFNGTYYGEMLRNTNRDRSKKIDLQAISGFSTLKFANVVENAEEVESDGVPKKIKSMVSFNDGGVWRKLKLELGCNQPACYLNLHNAEERIEEASFDNMVSSGSFSGVLVGSGNLGEFLGMQDKKGVYLSKDAGKTWKLVKEGNYKGAVGMYGSYLVLYELGVATNAVYVSIDDGAVWQMVQISTGDSVVIESLAFPGKMAKSTVVTLFVRKSGGEFAFASVDVGPMFGGLVCGESDYEWWNYSDGSDECILGEKMTMKRRKEGRKCQIREWSVQSDVKREECACTAADFECDYNWVRGEEGKCVKVKGAGLPAECGSAAYESVSTGYRKLAWSKCRGGVNLAGNEVGPCVLRRKRLNSLSGLEILTILVAGLGLSAAALVLWKRMKLTKSKRSWPKIGGRKHKYVRLSESDGDGAMEMDADLDILLDDYNRK